MIAVMWRALPLLVLVLACGGPEKVGKGEPQTAKEKQLREAKASGELDDSGHKWGGWRYQGDRSECFFVVGRKCFKSEGGACTAAKCKAPKACTTVGGGPAAISCK
jgi:hypothetical protein